MEETCQCSAVSATCGLVQFTRTLVVILTAQNVNRQVVSYHLPIT